MSTFFREIQKSFPRTRSTINKPFLRPRQRSLALKNHEKRKKYRIIFHSVIFFFYKSILYFMRKLNQYFQNKSSLFINKCIYVTSQLIMANDHRRSMREVSFQKSRNLTRLLPSNNIFFRAYLKILLFMRQ